MTEEIALDEAEVVEEQEEVATPNLPKTDSVVKLLAQKNAYKAEAAALRAEVDELKPLAGKVAEIEQMLAKQAVDQETKQAKDSYYSSNPNAKELESHIETFVEKWLTYDEAFKLAAAENKPELLLEAATLNKNSGWSKMTWVAMSTSKEPQWPSDFAKMSDNDFLARSNSQAKAERVSQWQLR